MLVQGIKDEDIRVVDETGSSPEEKEAIRQLKISCLLNISLCQLKLKDFPLVIKACNEAIELDSENVKALFRRSQVVVELSLGVA